MKKLQALYNEDANKIIEEATQDKKSIENLNFLIDLAMLTSDTKPAPEEPMTFVKTWNHPMQTLAQSCIKQLRKNSPT